MFLQKTLSLNDVSLKVEGDRASFAGYASVFGGVDSYGDTIIKGAFTSTLRAHGKPRMFYNHDWNVPVGKYTVAKEDDHGLYVEGELTPGHSLAADVYASMKHGTIDGLSIGGFLKEGDYEVQADGARIIRKWSKLMEVSPVVFPADGAARIGSVKRIDFEEALPACKSPSELEKLLRDAGLTKWEATAIVSRASAIFRAGEPQDEAQAKAIAELAARLDGVLVSR
jgi:HK97 family phage prohead protease